MHRKLLLSQCYRKMLLIYCTVSSKWTTELSLINTAPILTLAVLYYILQNLTVELNPSNSIVEKYLACSYIATTPPETLTVLSQNGIAEFPSNAIKDF